MRTTLALIALLVVPAATAHAEETFHPGTLGLSFGWPIGGGDSAGATYFISSTMAAFAEVGLNWNKQSDDDTKTSQTTTMLALAGGVKLYTARTAKLYTFLMPSVMINRESVTTEPRNVETSLTNTSYRLACDFGVEYLFTECCSLSGSVGLGVLFAGADNHDETVIATHRSVLAANFYW